VFYGTAQPLDDSTVWINPNGDTAPIPLPFLVSDGTTTWAVTVQNNAFVLTAQ
jgi:hypothetical protein